MNINCCNFLLSKTPGGHKLLGHTFLLQEGVYTGDKFDEGPSRGLLKDEADAYNIENTIRSFIGDKHPRWERRVLDPDNPFSNGKRHYITVPIPKGFYLWYPLKKSNMKKILIIAGVLVIGLEALSQNTTDLKPVCKSEFFKQILSDTSANSPYLKLILKFSNYESIVFARSIDLYLFLKKSNQFSYKDYVNIVRDYLTNNKPLIVFNSFTDNKNFAVVKKGEFDSFERNCQNEKYLKDNFFHQGVLDEEKAGERSIAISCCLFDLGYIIKEGDFTPGLSIKKFICN